MDFTAITNYIEDLYRDYEVLSAQEFISGTPLKEFCPIIETETARLLILLLRLKRPSKVLEIGTSIGFSTTSMAKIVREWDGKIITIEFDKRVAEQAKKNFESVGVSDVIELLSGDALELVPQMKETFDFIFLDPFNDIYPILLGDCVRLLNQGGVLIADDTLFPLLEGEGFISPLHEYNKQVAKNSKLESTILAVGDGVTIAVKK